MTARAFPNIAPTSRRYTPPSYPETRFEARNGAITFVRYGTKPVNAELELQYSNVGNNTVVQILDHYNSIGTDDHVTLPNEGPLSGMDASLQALFENGNRTLRWRYEGAPSIETSRRNIHSVRVMLIGYLDGV